MNLDMDVSRSARVPARNDGVENHTSMLVRRLYTSQPRRIFDGRTTFLQRIVGASFGNFSPARIFALGACVPDIDHGSDCRLAGSDVDKVDFKGERDTITVFGDRGADERVLDVEGSFGRFLG